MQLRYAYRLNPTPGQRQALAKAFGCARVVFNDAAAARRAASEAGQPFPTDVALSTALTAAKRTRRGRGWPRSRPGSCSRPARTRTREVGIDLGLTHFAVLSDGQKVDNPRMARKAAAQLRRAQQELARRQKGSANRRKSVDVRADARPQSRAARPHTQVHSQP